jgi:hypothetical protein
MGISNITVPYRIRDGHLRQWVKKLPCPEIDDPDDDDDDDDE